MLWMNIMIQLEDQGENEKVESVKNARLFYFIALRLIATFVEHEDDTFVSCGIVLL